MEGTVYCITNKINGTRYIGKTLLSLEKRFDQHFQDSKRESLEKRPLYQAIRKYGIENFKIETLEKVSYKKLSEREIYWISFFNTYEGVGYNATRGGDGKILYDYEKIVEKFKSGMLVGEIAEYFECDPGTISKVLKINGFNTRQNEMLKRKRAIVGEKEEEKYFFDSVPQAAEWLINQKYTSTTRKNVITAINRVIRKEKSRKTYLGFSWRLVEEEEKKSS